MDENIKKEIKGVTILRPIISFMVFEDAIYLLLNYFNLGFIYIFILEPIVLIIFTFVYFIFIEKIFANTIYKKRLYLVASLVGILIGYIFLMIFEYVSNPGLPWIGEEIGWWLIMLEKSSLTFVITFGILYLLFKIKNKKVMKI
jgi:hypothetical protein